MDALDVVLDDLGLGAVVAQRRLPAGAMTLAAQRGDVLGVGARFGLQVPEDPVRAMAVGAHRRVGAALGRERAVAAALVGGDDLGVTHGAVDFRRHADARPALGRVDAGMALGAGNLDVARVLELVAVVEHRDQLTLVMPGEVVLGVARYAVLVGHALGVEHLAHPVGLVAVHARRDRARTLLPQLALDDLAVHGLDAHVALGAGAGHVLARDAGARIGVRELVVRGVTAGAHRGGQEPLL